VAHRISRRRHGILSSKPEDGAMFLIDTLLILAMMFIFFLPITDYKTVRMKLCVLCALALVLTVSVAKTRALDPQVASLAR
jgi:ABC-type xylose transport system permease subunit